ncbi:MAG: ATP-binding protein [SAR324 cluster bacterium]|nr:ATP-binding protein [SAR324 cluster bacterium]
MRNIKFFSRLKTKFFLWLLGSMTVIAAAISGLLFLTFHGEIEQRMEGLVLEEVGMGRDIVQNLLDSGVALPELKRLLRPVSRSEVLSLAVVDAGGRAVLRLQSNEGEPRQGLPSQDEIRETLQRGVTFADMHGRRFAAGLPIRLRSGETGVFYITVRHKSWWRKGPPYRLLLSIAVVLVVGWLLSWPIARHLARPLDEMAATADALGKGDLDARITLKRRHFRRSGDEHGDEIDSLAHSFNAMAGNLQKIVLGHKQLLGDISHELRSPLARLKVGLELAHKEAGEETAQYLQGVEAQADAIDELIGELLAYSRLETAPYELHLEDFPPRQLLEEAALPLRAEREARHIAVEFHGAEAPALISADRRLLLRALGNGLKNALVYAPEGSTVILGLRTEQGRLIYSVADRGPGVPVEMLERIFEPFVRTDAARARASGGTGLGLAIARRCMEAHGGGAEATLGEEQSGLTLSLWLPWSPPGDAPHKGG